METTDWRATVTVTPEPRMRAALLARLEGGPPSPSVWVTDLIDPRPAYYRRRVVVPPTPERRERQLAGRLLHALIESALAAPGNFEVRVRREGIVGQIDLFEHEPTELKTTEALPEPDALAETRPGYLDQLGMYCALTDRPSGRLLVVESVQGAPGRCQVYDVKFRSLSRVWEEMRGRASALREADLHNAPQPLPRCGWFDRGCEFQDAHVCDCTGGEPEAVPGIRNEVDLLRLNGPLTETVQGQLRGLASLEGPPAVERFRDLLYPRRTYFERTAPIPDAPAGSAVPVPRQERWDLFRSLLDAIDSGPSGEATRVPVPTGEPLESVPCLEGFPYLLKVTRAPRRRSGEELVGAQPHYFLDLGFRCASLGVPQGWLILGYERNRTWEERLDVFRVRFHPLESVGGIASDRAAALARALLTARPETLPACPSWMVEDCPYRERCGCGPSPSAPGGWSR